jgi:hypothetical protein
MRWIASLRFVEGASAGSAAEPFARHEGCAPVFPESLQRIRSRSAMKIDPSRSGVVVVRQVRLAAGQREYGELATQGRVVVQGRIASDGA